MNNNIKTIWACSLTSFLTLSVVMYVMAHDIMPIGWAPIIAFTYIFEAMCLWPFWKAIGLIAASIALFNLIKQWGE